MSVISVLESLFGWVYFVIWSATFYPQAFLMLRRKTGAGFSIDYMLINIVGFTCYFIFTFASYAIPVVTQTYKEHTGYSPQVNDSDVFFAGHGAIMCLVLISIMLYFPPRTAPNLAVFVITMTIQLAIFIGLALCLMGWLDWYIFLNLAGLVKVLASLVKHFPQAFLNCARQSTVGYSFTMVMLDVVGGFFSIAQQAVRCIRLHSFAPFTSNYAKTFLAAESLAFDFFFMAQHLIWYTDRRDIDRDSTKQIDDQPLLI